MFSAKLGATATLCLLVLGSGAAPALTLDVGVSAVLTPRDTVDSGAVVVPAVVVRNYGTDTAVASFPVTLVVGPGYRESVFAALGPGTTDTVSFPAWTARPTGVQPVVCFTALVGDENPANDTIRDSVRVLGPPVHDVGAVAIVAPVGTLRTGDTVIPRARVTNFGNMSERYFDARLRIGTSYSRAATVVKTLPPDSTVELTFEPWVAASGRWAVSCSTMLPGDTNRANDSVTSSVQVFRRAVLSIEPDRSGRLRVGESEAYRFHALVDGDTGGVVEVVRPSAPAGWIAELRDSAGAILLTDTDGDGLPDLGYVAPGVPRWFSLDVQTPAMGK